MTQCSEQEIARLLPLVSPQRREQALRYTHIFGQFCCLKSYELLTQLLVKWGGDNVDKMPEFVYNEHGAPYLAVGPYFSISHCKQGIAVAVSEKPIGIDIESIRPLNDSLVRKTMNSEEQYQIAASFNPEIEFIRLWTRKEAYVKMIGTGIISEIQDILSGVHDVQWEELVNFDNRFICTICKKDIR